MITNHHKAGIRPSERIEALQQALGHRFQDPDLLALACTHASCLEAQAEHQERVHKTNERLEFLGDTLLDAACGEMLYDRFPTADEGTLSRYKSHLVSRRILARALDRLQLTQWCVCGDKMPMPWPDSVKANFAESLLAAIYKDAGWAALQTAVACLLSSEIDQVAARCAGLDAKGGLQDWALKTTGRLPTYQTQRSGGSDHEPQFCCQVSIGDAIACGEGSSRRRAETAAALRLLEQLTTDSSGIDQS